MKPYLLIEGSNHALQAFEDKVASSIEAGYALSGELVTQALSDSKGTEVRFYQAMVLDEDEEEFETFDLEEDSEDENEAV